MEKSSFDIGFIRNFFKSADIGFCLLNDRHEIVLSNKKLSRLTGLSQKSMEGTSIEALFTDDDFL